MDELSNLTKKFEKFKKLNFKLCGSVLDESC